MSRFQQLSSELAIGLALFAMFFGSGNLVFPLTIGVMAGDGFTPAVAGFIVSGVLLPFAGVVTMVLFHGNYRRFFETLGPRIGFLFSSILLTAWIPLGSGPRCVTICFANIQHYLGSTPLWLFSLLYCSILLLISLKKSRAIDILGYFLTPLLLLSIGVIIYQGVMADFVMPQATETAPQIFWEAMIEGYQTQDLIASFFFAATIIQVLRARNSGEKETLRTAMRSSIVGVLLLAAVYIGLIFVAATCSSMLGGVNKDALLTTLVQQLMPVQMQPIASIAVALACMTTNVALTLVYADFLRNDLLSRFALSERSAIVFSTLLTFALSLIGFAGISAMTGLLMQILYPLLIALMCGCLFGRSFGLMKLSAATQKEVAINE